MNRSGPEWPCDYQMRMQKKGGEPGPQPGAKSCFHLVTGPALFYLARAGPGVGVFRGGPGALSVGRERRTGSVTTAGLFLSTEDSASTW